MSNEQKTRSQQAAALLTEAMQEHQQGNLNAADSLYSQTLVLSPRNMQALRLQGILARESGDLKKSLELLERAHSIDPQSTAPLNELALSNIVQGNLDNAGSLLNQSLELNANDATALTNLGALLQHRGHILSAIACYQKLLSNSPDDIEVRCNLAKAQADAGQTDAALDSCDAAISLTESHPYTLATKGAVLTDFEQYSDAETLLQRACSAIPDDDMSLVNLALCQDALGDTQAAAQSLKQALQANEINARAIADLANCLIKLGDVQSALNLCEGFLEFHPHECLVIASYALALSAANATEQAHELTDFDSLVKVYSVGSDQHDIQQINTALALQIKNDPSLLNDPVSKSTSGGAQTGELDLSFSSEFKSLNMHFAQSVRTAINDYAKNIPDTHPIHAGGPDDWSLRTWATVLSSGGRQSSHMHPLGWISGVYYVQTPDDVRNTKSNAGNLLFGVAPERFKQVNAPARYHTPEEGQLVLFPSWFWHQTMPFSAASERISIAFDVMPANALRML
jgi:uncharacterized protein (TIGR02466 family)